MLTAGKPSLPGSVCWGSCPSCRSPPDSVPAGRIAPALLPLDFPCSHYHGVKSDLSAAKVDAPAEHAEQAVPHHLPPPGPAEFLNAELRCRIKPSAQQIFISLSPTQGAISGVFLSLSLTPGAADPFPHQPHHPGNPIALGAEPGGARGQEVQPRGGDLRVSLANRATCISPVALATSAAGLRSPSLGRQPRANPAGVTSKRGLGGEQAVSLLRDSAAARG